MMNAHHWLIWVGGILLVVGHGLCLAGGAGGWGEEPPAPIPATKKATPVLPDKTVEPTKPKKAAPAASPKESDNPKPPASRQDVETALKNLTADDVEVRLVAIGDLKAHADSKAVAPLLELLSDENERIRADAMLAAAACWGKNPSRPVTPLANLLRKDPVATVRQAAAQAIGQIGNASQSVGPLQLTLETEKDAPVRIEIIRVLGQLGQTRSCTILAKIATKDPEDSVQLEAYAALGKINNEPTAKKLILPLLNLGLKPSIPIEEWRQMLNYTAQRITRLDQSAVPTLLKAMTHPHGRIRLLASHALSQIKDPRMTKPVILLLTKEKNGWGRVFLLRALSHQQDPKTIPVVRGYLKDDFPSARGQAAICLGELDDKESVPKLMEIYTQSDQKDEQDAQFRRGAIVALGKLGDPKAMPVLQAARKDSSGEVRDAAEAAITQLNRKTAAKGKPAAKR